MKTRPRAADKLTRKDVRIAVCTNCGRYRLISTETNTCTHDGADYCQRNGKAA